MSGRFGETDDPCPDLYRPYGPLAPWDRVNSRLLVGGDDYQYDPEILESLLDEGVTHILDCRTLHELESARRSASFTGPQRLVEFTTNHTEDDGSHKPATYFEFATGWAQRALESGGVMYVHCAMGVNRGPSNAYAILRSSFGMDSAHALRAIRSVRPGAYVGYWRDVDEAIDAR